MRRQLIVVLSIILIDSISLGFVFTNLPNLLTRFGGEDQHIQFFGLMMAAYAGLQFLCSPVLGALSDKFGRKPILLASILGAVVDFSAMAFGSSLAVLFIGRMIGGATSANALLISAFVADLTDEEDRAKGFGWIFAAFGIGLVIGPAIGGTIGEWSPTAPFVVAIGASLLNLFLATAVLKETHERDEKPVTLSTLNPFKHLYWAFGLSAIVALIPLYLALTFSGAMTATVFPVYTPDQFGWSPQKVGLFLSALGICNALSQGLLLGPLVKHFGERWTVVIGMVCEGSAMLGLATVSQGWIAFLFVPLIAIGGVALPTVQSIVSVKVGPERQGEIQGVLASGNSLMMAIAPLAATAILYNSQSAFRGLIWCVVPLLYLVAGAVYLLKLRRRAI